MDKSILKDKSYSFAIRVVEVVKTLQVERKEYVLSRQLLRSGTAIGALVSEAKFGQSKAETNNDQRLTKSASVQKKQHKDRYQQ